MKSIAVVEDEPFMREELSHLLQKPVIRPSPLPNSIMWQTSFYVSPLI